MKITFISDTHGMHNSLSRKLLPGGDVLIHSGDMSNVGTLDGIRRFCEWFNLIEGYNFKIFIAGNHDFGFEVDPITATRIVREYPNIIYLEDSQFDIYDIETDKTTSIFGTPWVPSFGNWAFNVMSNTDRMEEKRNLIPENIDILITHCPPIGILDTAGPPYNRPLLGCEMLYNRVMEVTPKINVFGHIHGSYGYKFINDTHFINATLLNEYYDMVNNPVVVEWDKETNEMKFL